MLLWTLLPRAVKHMWYNKMLYGADWRVRLQNAPELKIALLSIAFSAFERKAENQMSFIWLSTWLSTCWDVVSTLIPTPFSAMPPLALFKLWQLGPRCRDICICNHVSSFQKHRWEEPFLLLPSVHPFTLSRQQGMQQWSIQRAFISKQYWYNTTYFGGGSTCKDWCKNSSEPLCFDDGQYDACCTVQ